jgi:glutamyl-tRNA reductase
MLISIAVDYRHADVATRERFHLTPERMQALYGPPGPEAGARPRRAAPAVVALATCNRSEVYAWRPDAAAGPAALERACQALARRWMGSVTAARQLLDVARRRTGDAAARHLFRVASGIESQVLGDAQLLGQLREAHQRAGEAGAAGTMLHRLFERALHVGKRVRAETGLSSGRYSVGAEAANVAARRFGSLARARVVVIGCGKTGERVARQLAKIGATDVVVVNRTLERAHALAATVRGRAAPLEALYGELALADIVIVATSATTPIVYADPLVTARRRCATSQYPLLFFDLSVPRNVDPAVASISGVVVVDLDALRPAVAAAERERLSSVPVAEGIVDEELADFVDWMRAADARDAIRPLCAALEDVCMREVGFAAGEAVARRTAQRIIAKLLARPMLELRGAALRGERLDDLTGAIARLFPGEPADAHHPPPRDGRPRARADLPIPVGPRAAPLQETA